VSLWRFPVLNVEMGSEGPKRVTIHVTGFKKFQGVAVNPTEIILHLGLNSGVLKFSIERQAVNEATFRCPDELGWQPQVYMLLCCDNNVCLLKFRSNVKNDIFTLQQSPILPGDGGIAQAREKILQILRNGGHKVMISDDAGRFVCNYVYYHSLRFAEEKGHESLFVHVPLFSSINEEAQMKFTAALLEAIASTC
ncbi:hypothetical protein RJ639_006968, partial [Escallonia herrerae]